MQASWVNNTPPVPFKELRAPVAGTRREILPPITSSLLRILFNDNPAQTFADLRGFIDEIPFTGAIPDDPPIPPEFTVQKLHMNLRGFTLAGGAGQSRYADVEALFQNPPAVVDRALFVTWTKKVIGYTSDHFREDAAHAPARVGLLGSDADNRILDRVTIKIQLSPPPSPEYDVAGRWAPSSRSGSPSSRGHPSIPPSAAGSPDSAVGDPALAGGRRKSRRILLTYRRRYGVNERASVRRKTRRNSRTRVVRSGPSSNPNSRRRS
jgi:hypothetical protein